MKLNFHKAMLIFSIFLMLFIIYHLIKKMFGGSLGVDELQSSAIIGIVSYLIYLTKEVALLSGKFSQFEKRFGAMAADVKVIKEDVTFIKYDLKSDIRLIKKKLAV